MVDPATGGKETTEAEGKVAAATQEAVNLDAWRTQVVSLEQQSREAYGKAVLILSGGALGLSLVVVKDYLRLRGGGGSGLMALALLCWALSVVFVLFSSISSRKVLRSAMGRVANGAPYSYSEELSERVASRLGVGSGLLFLAGVAFFAAYVAIEPAGGVKQQAASTASEEIARVLSVYDTIREVCPECSTDEAHKVLQVCESSYVVPDTLHEACPNCTEKGILQLSRRCMEKWNSSHTR